MAGGCGVSRVRFKVKVRVSDCYVQGLKCPMTEVTIHQFGPIYRTEIITSVQCMYADYVVWGDGSGALDPLSSDRQHLSCDVCLEVRGEIIRTVLCGIVY